MSGLVKAVKKVFKKVKKFVKKYWKVIVIAAAIYFTAGVALSAFPSTASFAAGMPGFGSGAGFNSIFSRAAVSMGFQGASGSGIAAIAGNTAGAATGAGVTLSAATPQATSTTVAADAAGNAIAGTATKTGSALASTVAQETGKEVAKTSIFSKIGTGVKNMSGMEKITLAKTVFEGVGGLLEPSQDEINQKEHDRKFQQANAIGRDGTGPGYYGVVDEVFGGQYPGAGSQSTGAGSAYKSLGSVSPFEYDGRNSPNQNYTAQAQGAKTAVNQGYANKNYNPVGG